MRKRLKNWFPVPRLPQIRYWVLGFLVYGAFKVYVALLSGSPDDEPLPRTLRVVFVDMPADCKDYIYQNGITPSEELEAIDG